MIDLLRYDRFLMSAVEELLSEEDKEYFRSVFDLARDFRTRVGLELPDEEAALNFAENRKFGKISDLLYEFFQARRERWPHAPLLVPPSPRLSPRRKFPDDRKFRLEVSDQKPSFETESRLYRHACRKFLSDAIQRRRSAAKFND